MKVDKNRGLTRTVRPTPGRGPRVDRVADDLYRQALDRQDLLERFHARTAPVAQESLIHRFLNFWRTHERH